ncbi:MULTISPECIES: cytochrome o ubiquinol oxidase subunit IV [Pseudomonas]|uniref:Cytochrome bo(3) ubiquinol oxidase subunit 4 n=1 Tax=Pseudomonas saxonica TaxID=2600598 RepID=A0A5C5PRC0_9PSED|nr:MULTISPECIES: cytochrome o ubiquinol oxidase subunit IV [Pseudomonas]MCH4873445.1 cytochrome o ubiquinol oxidase subunit IV [Pseudomonas sp. TMW22091]TWR82888.1 cytochrome o ubiquinol oxidase subunit IV [Pseudomonas saxonica]TWR92523.1 cytochrome o ubiquinol oxidase subunit IV [Pseudomonas saxonica]WRQ74053.1 cytochrome o ubiquinol oxidase subunit IV [Pseudomonas saxonica]
MNPQTSPTRDLQAESRREKRSYYIGICAALILTLIAFGLVWLKVVAGTQALVVLGVLALLQVVVHLHYFMHIDLGQSHRDDLMLILFTSLILLLIIAGTVWILWDLHARMM